MNTREIKTERKPTQAGATAAGKDKLPENQPDELADREQQEKYRKAHLAQLRQLQCPGCGEDELF